MTESTPSQTSNIRKVPLIWPQRLRVMLVLLLFTGLLAAIIIIFRYDLVTKQLQTLRGTVIQHVGNQGFILNDIYISGHNRTLASDIRDKLNLKRGDNFFEINPQQIKHRLETLPWIRDVTVKRSFLPNIIQIHIQEKEVLALWQLNGRLYPLDHNGYVIEADYRPTKPTLLVIGQDAPDHIIYLLNAIKKVDPDYLNRLKAANYISQRRWNLIFDNLDHGVTVKLPENDINSAIAGLINLDKKTSILKRKLTIIDLRLPNKIVVKMRKDHKK